MSNEIVRLDGLEETLRAFKNIQDTALKEKKIRLLEKRILRRYYIPKYQRLIRAELKDSSGNVAKSIGVISSRKKVGRGQWISEKAGPRVKGQFRAQKLKANSRRAKRSYTYESGGWILPFFEKGTKERFYRIKSGRKSTGKIKPEHLQERAFRLAKASMRKNFEIGILKMMERAIKAKSLGKII